MSEPNKHINRSLTLRQFIGLAILLLLVAGFVVAMHLTDLHLRSTIHHEIVVADTAAADSFLAALKVREQKERYPRYERPKRDTVPLRPHLFDPNTADSVELLELGLRPWQARTLIRYRSKGARFKKTEDLRKLYFMSDSLYATLSPFVEIQTPDADTTAADTIKQAKPLFAVSEKRDTILEINSADTTELQLLRGVGRYTAVQIVRYRQQLGGYVSLDQLREIPKIKADSIIPHLTLDTTLVRKITVRKATVEYLQRHPYIRFEQAKCLYELRRTYIPLDLNTFLLKQECFSDEDLQRILPYLSFE